MLSIASTGEEEELIGLKLSLKIWASFINSQRVLPEQKITGITSALALELRFLCSPHSTMCEKVIRNRSMLDIDWLMFYVI